jgi:hypothetical protein
MFAAVGVELRMTTMRGVFGLLFPMSWNGSKRGMKQEEQQQDESFTLRDSSTNTA